LSVIKILLWLPSGTAKKSRSTFVKRLRSGNDRYLKQLSKLLEVLAEISENNEKNNSNCKFEGAENQIISDKLTLLQMIASRAIN